MLSLGQMGEWQHGLPVLGALVVMICVGRYAVLVEALLFNAVRHVSQSRMNKENEWGREYIVKRSVG